jgi:hypothetical protein
MTPAVSEAPTAPAPVARAVAEDFMSGGEVVILAVKPSMWRMVFDSAPWLATSVALAVLVLSIGTPLAGVSTSLAAQFVLLAGLGRLGVAVLRWVPSWHLLTNRRIMDIRGVRTPRVSSLFLTDIADTDTSATLPEKIVSTGSVAFIPELADQAPRVWRSIPNHLEVHERVRRAIREARRADL